MATPGILARLLTRPCTLVYRAESTPDVYGDPGWTETTVPAVCYAEQANGFEPGDEPNLQTADWRFVLETTAALDGLDAIDLEGARFEVVGPPWMAKDPRTNADHHVELVARFARASA